MAKATDQQIKEFLIANSSWSLVNGRLEKTSQFANFARAMVFVNRAVNPIEENQNYPMITITYNRVKVGLFTHTEGAISDKDLLVAKEMEELV